MSNINNLYGIENVQAGQLDLLNAAYFNNDSITALSTILNGVNRSMVDLSSNITGALARQDEMLDIVKSDKQKLDNKTRELEIKRTTQIREIELTESHRKRYLTYIRGILVIVVAVSILWLTRFLAGMFPFLPDALITVVYGVIIVVTVIILYYMYLEFETHDRLQYDELKLKGPDAKPTKMPNVDASDNLLNPYFGCNGQECCGKDTIWTPDVGKCVKYVIPPTTPPTVTAAPTETVAPTTAPPSGFQILLPPIF
jgi:hypothetical protein